MQHNTPQRTQTTNKTDTTHHANLQPYTQQYTYLTATIKHSNSTITQLYKHTHNNTHNLQLGKLHPIMQRMFLLCQDSKYSTPTSTQQDT